MGLRLQTNYSEEFFPARLKSFSQRLHESKSAVDDHSPFYAPEIFDKADALVRIGVREELACQVNDPRNGSWFRDGASNAHAFAAACVELSRAIRERISQLSVRE